MIARDDHAHDDLASGRATTLHDVEHYRVYLQAELAKLRNVGDAHAFLARSGCDPSRFGLSPSTAWITRAFNSQDRVDTFVTGLTSEQLVALTRCCAKWRENGIDDQLRRARRAEYIDAPIAKILVARAERDLWEAFERDGWRLTEVARDPAVLGAEPYRAFSPGREIAFRVKDFACLSEDIQTAATTRKASYRSRSGRSRVSAAGATSAFACVPALLNHEGPRGARARAAAGAAHRHGLGARRRPRVDGPAPGHGAAHARVHGTEAGRAR